MAFVHFSLLTHPFHGYGIFLVKFPYNTYQPMESIEQSTNSNDYAVAKVLNEHVAALILMVPIADSFGLQENFELKEINKAYVLLTDELEKLYDRNPKLLSITPEPVWRRFEVLESSTWEINEYFEDPDNTILQTHIAKVDRLCIISGTETATLPTKQQELIEYADLVRSKYGKLLQETRDANKLKAANNWHITEYTLTYKPDGTLLVNDVLKLKKAHAGSATERLLEQALKSPHVLFKPDLGQTSRNLSTVLSSTGITPTLRQLFFPTVNSNKGIIFRPTITREQADNNNIDTTELDLELKKLGAEVKHGK
jgi:hypothetical protein